MRAVTFAVLIGLATCTGPAGVAEPSGPNLGKAPDVQDGAPPQADLPRVVLVSDSIRLGYAPTVEKELAGKAIVISPQANGGDSSNVLKNLDAWVIRAQPDVVHFNCGIHDIKKSRTTGQFQTSPEQYEANLRKIVDRIRNDTPRSCSPHRLRSLTREPLRCGPRRTTSFWKAASSGTTRLPAE